MNIVKILSASAKKGQFHFLEAINRAVAPAHVTKIADSIETFDEVLRPVIVAEVDFFGARRKYIIDGQHLYHALMRLGRDIPYVEVKIKTLEELIEKIALLNSSSKSWKIDDYIHTWSFYKKPYQVLLDLKNKYNMETVIIAQLLHSNVIVATSNYYGSNQRMSRLLKRGLLEIDDLEVTTKVLDNVKELAFITKDLNMFQKRIVVGTIIERIKANPKHDQKKFKDNAYAKREEIYANRDNLEAIKNLLKY